MNLSLRFGRVRIGPGALVLGLAAHLLLPALCLFGAYWLDRWWKTSLDWPLAVRLSLGGLMFVSSVALEGAAMPPFFRLGGSPSPFQPTESLVVGGPYRYCRHPIYIAYIGYVVALGIMLGLLATFVMAVALWACLTGAALFREEPALRRRFGEQFDAYRRRTPFMIPRFRRRR